MRKYNRLISVQMFFLFEKCAKFLGALFRRALYIAWLHFFVLRVLKFKLSYNLS